MLVNKSSVIFIEMSRDIKFATTRPASEAQAQEEQKIRSKETQADNGKTKISSMQMEDYSESSKIINKTINHGRRDEHELEDHFSLCIVNLEIDVDERNLQLTTASACDGHAISKYGVNGLIKVKRTTKELKQDAHYIPPMGQSSIHEHTNNFQKIKTHHGRRGGPARADGNDTDQVIHKHIAPTLRKSIEDFTNNVDLNRYVGADDSFRGRKANTTMASVKNVYDTYTLVAVLEPMTDKPAGINSVSYWFIQLFKSPHR